MSPIRSKSSLTTYIVWVGMCLWVELPGILHAASFTLVSNTKLTHEMAPPNHLPVFHANAFLRLSGNLGISPTLEALDLQGSLLSSVSVVVPEAHVVGVNAFSRAGDGAFVAGGWCESADGKMAGFIAVVPTGGGPPQIIRTNPYGVEKLVVAADGTIWTVGNVLVRKSDPPDTDPKGGTVRHFDRSGNLFDSYYPFASLDDRVRVMMGFMAASHDRVGWISNADPQPGRERLGAYVEFTAAGVLEYPLPPMAPVAGAVLYGLALTDDGGVFAKVAVVDGQGSQVVSLDRSTRTWNAVSGFGDSLNDAFLTGASGNTIAIWTPATKNVNFYERK
jgi:hypothetical protein